MPKASRETAQLIYKLIRDWPDNRGVSIAEIMGEVKKSRGLVSAVLSSLRESGCVVGVQGSRRVIRYKAVEAFPLSQAEKADQRDRIKELVKGGGTARKVLKQIKEILE